MLESLSSIRPTQLRRDRIKGERTASGLITFCQEAEGKAVASDLPALPEA